MLLQRSIGESDGKGGGKGGGGKGGGEGGRKGGGFGTLMSIMMLPSGKQVRVEGKKISECRG